MEWARESDATFERGGELNATMVRWLTQSQCRDAELTVAQAQRLLVVF
jgi:hypothetical protein